MSWSKCLLLSVQIALHSTGGGTFVPTVTADDEKLIGMLQTQFHPSETVDSDTGYHTITQECVSRIHILLIAAHFVQ